MCPTHLYKSLLPLNSNMSKLPMNPFLRLSRRWYKVAAESGSTVRVQPAVTMAKVATTESGSSIVADDQHQHQAFWMRDPKTGNWIPETHFEEVDVADLREKLLPNKH